MATLIEIAQFLLGFLIYAIIIQAVLSWLVAFNVVNLSNEFVRQVWNGLNRALDPLYRPVRRLLPDFGSLDLSPIVVLIAIHILRSIVLENWHNSLLTG